MSSGLLYTYHQYWTPHDWISMFKLLPDVKLNTKTNELVIEVSDKEVFDRLQRIFYLSKIKFSLLPTDNEFFIISLERKINIPIFEFYEIIEMLSFLLNMNEEQRVDEPLFKLFLNIFSTILTTIKFISDQNHPVNLLIEHLKLGKGFSEIDEQIISNFLIFKNQIYSKQDYNTIELPINIWLHILRHPSKAKTNLIRYFKKLLKINDTLIVIHTKIPLIEPKKTFLGAFTLLENQESLIESSENIVSYWLTLVAIILRNIAYAVVKINNFTLEELDSKDIIFYNKLKPKLDKFIDSCLNPDLVEAYKLFDNVIKEKLPSITKGYETYNFNRGVILEKRLKKAQNEFNKKSSSKILRKRVNRRSKRFFEFLEQFIIVFNHFLNETTEISSVSGKYTSLDDFFPTDVKNILLKVKKEKIETVNH